MNHLKSITFDVHIPNFNYKLVSIVFCDLWLEDRRNEVGFKEEVSSYFQTLGQTMVNTVVVSEFPSLLGVHLQRGSKRVMREISRMLRKPELFTFSCFNHESKLLFMEAIRGDKNELLESFTSIPSPPGTDYF
jgi:hypothetical protein